MLSSVGRGAGHRFKSSEAVVESLLARNWKILQDSAWNDAVELCSFTTDNVVVSEVPRRLGVMQMMLMHVCTEFESNWPRRLAAAARGSRG